MPERPRRERITMPEETHRAVLVVELAITDAKQIAEALTAMNPPSLPHFAGAVRVAVGDVATALTEWLDEDTNQERVAVKPEPLRGDRP